MIDTHIDMSRKAALVVGGSSGIGNAIARAFLVAGATVHVTGTRAGAQDYRDEEGSELEGLEYSRLDLSDRGALAAWTPAFSTLDVLVLCQGAVQYGRKEFDIGGFTEVLEVNLVSVMACAMKFYDHLKAASGALIVVSSVAAFHATKGNPAYNASKTGAYGLTRTLAQAWAPDGIRVNGIAPGMIATKMTTITTGNETRRTAFEKRIAVGRIGTPDDCAGVALFLASPLAAYVVGQTIIVDGGMLL